MTPTTAFVLPALISAALAALPVMISVVQTSCVRRQKHVLCSLANLCVSKTEYYRLAMYYIDKIEQIGMTASYRVPMIFFSFVVLFLSAMTFLGALVPSYFEHYSVILGGMQDLSNKGRLVTYQTGTFVAGAWAFIGAYVYLLYRLVSRINNNDIYPITFYYYTNRLVIACLVAGLARHATSFLLQGTPVPVDTPLLAVLGLAIGWRPDLWLATIYSKFTGRLRIFHGQREPDPDLLPERLSLNLLQGMTNEHRERLEELDISDCHALANQNPFIIFARTSYSLLHVVDWMAQAQLAVLVGAERLAQLRSRSIRNIFVFYDLFQAEKCVLARFLEMDEESVEALQSYLRACPCIGRLRDVWARLSERIDGRDDTSCRAGQQSIDAGAISQRPAIRGLLVNQ